MGSNGVPGELWALGEPDKAEGTESNVDNFGIFGKKQPRGGSEQADNGSNGNSEDCMEISKEKEWKGKGNNCTTTMPFTVCQRLFGISNGVF